MAALAIRNIRARPVLAPFSRPPVAARGAMPRVALVLIDLETDQGVTGRSYVFAFMPGTLEPLVGCLAAMAELLQGDVLAPADCDLELRQRMTLIDTPGILGIEMSSHLFPEISAHLLAVTPTARYLEFVDWAAPMLQRPLEICDGHAVIADRPGTGLEWNEEAVERYAVG